MSVHKYLNPEQVQRMPQDKLKISLKLNFSEKGKVVLPNAVDLRPKFPAVYDQGQLGSCTANALCGAFQYYIGSIFNPSRLFLYYCERALQGTTDIDAGAYLYDGVKCLQTTGVCHESDWPYFINNFKKKPIAKCYTNALKHKVLAAFSITNNLNSIQQALSSGYPLVVGILVYASFESLQVANTGIVPMPKPREQILGGHAVMIVGYDNKKQQFIMRNSWGSRWGVKGYFYLPYSYILNPSLSSDIWAISKVN